MKEFFDIVRRNFGPLSASQVEGIELILKRSEYLPLRHRSYILGTTWHETDKTMRPIEEYGRGKGKRYGVPDPATGQIYYGRGFVQLTWKDNYEKAQKRLKAMGKLPAGYDLVRKPSLVMEPEISALILIVGMTEGWFTTHKLSDFTDYKSMRRIVNGTDDAELIAGHARKFEEALKALPAKPTAPVDPTPIVIPPAPQETPAAPVPVSSGGILAFIARLISIIFGGK